MWMNLLGLCLLWYSVNLRLAFASREMTFAPGYDPRVKEIIVKLLPVVRMVIALGAAVMSPLITSIAFNNSVAPLFGVAPIEFFQAVWLIVLFNPLVPLLPSSPVVLGEDK